MIKLIAIDMDGTLLDEDKQLPQENITALQKAAAQGVQIVLCTGRAMTGVVPFFEQLALGEQEYVIINNGCSTYETANWQLIHDYHLSPEELRQLYAIVAEEAGVQLTAFDSDNHYYVIADQASDLVTYDATLIFTEPTPITLDELLAKDTIIFEAMYLADPERLNAFEDKYGEQLSEIFSTVRSQDYIYECLPKGATKASALDALAKSLHISPEHIMAIGDANNDLEMLAYAHHSVAMGNANPAVKAIAKYQTGSNQTAGVAQAIYEHVLTD